MPRPTRSFLVLLAFSSLSGAALAGNWERFRGPNGTGTINDKDVPLTFGPTENLLWKVPLAGIGNASPVIWGKHLFLQSASTDGKDRTLYCFDTTDGKVRWQQSIPGVTVRIRKDSSLASSTPATDGEAVYVAFWDGKDIIVSAYDFQGTKRWSKNLGGFSSQHGAGASPILYKDKLILANDMDREDFHTKKRNEHPSVLVALDKKTGAIAWETPREAVRACYSAPFFWQRPGQGEPDLVVVSTTSIAGYNPSTGARLWEKTDWQGKSAPFPLRTVASTAVSDNVLIACSGDGKGPRLAVALALPNSAQADPPERLWENPKEFPYVPTPLAHGNHFYFVSDDGYAGCYNARTGKRVWRERLADDDGFTASLLLIDGKVYAASDAGDVHVFAAEPEYRALAHNKIGERLRATPAVADGRIYFRGERHLYCFGKAK
jgi:outer membrane protein assembly factor BamB